MKTSNKAKSHKTTTSKAPKPYFKMTKAERREADLASLTKRVKASSFAHIFSADIIQKSVDLMYDNRCEKLEEAFCRCAEEDGAEGHIAMSELISFDSSYPKEVVLSVGSNLALI